MRRVAIYARYSSAHQNERSIDDQVRLCREHAERQGWAVVEVYADYAISGAHLLTRPQARAMLEAARGGAFDVVLAEALDRLSRDQEDIAGVYKRLTFAGVALITVSEGEVNELHVGLKGTMNALFLADLAKKIRRGQAGNIERGVSAGGLGYGYDVVRQLDDKGEPVRGLRAVNEEQAAVIRRIFAEYVAGRSARQIAHGLNRDGVPSPTGGIWRSSTINGNRARGSGILWNDAYAGRLVHNRVRMVKDPETGKRVSRPNPQSEWQVREVPELRIVDDATWEAAQAVKERYTNLAGSRPARRPKHLLSGLLRCGCCGASMTVYSGDKTRCATRREGGACSNDRTITLSAAAERITKGWRAKLLSAKAMAAYVTEYEKERRRLAADRARSQVKAAGRLREIEAACERIVDQIAEGLASETLKRRLLELEREAADLRNVIEAPEDANVVSIHPSTVAGYRERIDNLLATLSADDPANTSATLLRSLIDHIAVVPLEGRGNLELRVYTRVDTLIGLATGTHGPGCAAVVAEERYRRNAPGRAIPIAV